MRKRAPNSVIVSAWLVLLSACSPAVTVAPTPAPTPLPTVAPTPTLAAARYEAAECEFQVPDGRQVDCGYLFVPEDRSQAGTSMIRLHVATVRTKNPHPAPDPVVYLDGGPGAHTLDSLDWYLEMFQYLLVDRDLILFDQRGIGYSQPSLNCPEVEDQLYKDLAQNLTPQDEGEHRSKAAQACRDRLVQEGISLAAYTTTANAADVNDLRIALAYGEWNLYGASHGTRLALTISRDFPAGVRSMVLDSICPLQVDHYAQIAANAERALSVLFAQCAADASCDRAFPNLETVFYDLVAQVDANPVTLELTRPSTDQKYEMVVNGDRLTNAFFGLLYATEAIPQLPRLIYQLHGGGWEELPYWISWWEFMNDGVSEGMWLSVECEEESPFSSPDAIQAASASVRPCIRQAVYFEPSFEMCAIWPANVARAVENEPVVSDVPALILAGEYDPIHPPSWGRLASETLSQSQYVEFPGFGHGVLGARSYGVHCSQQVVLAFLGSPGESIDVSCLAKLRPVFYTQ